MRCLSKILSSTPKCSTCVACWFTHWLAAWITLLSAATCVTVQWPNLVTPPPHVLLFRPIPPPERLKAYTIIDNNGFGKYDWDMIANEWEMDEVKGWGLDISALGEILPDGAYDFGDDNIDGAAKSDKADRNLCKCPQCGYIANKKEFEHENIS